MRSEIFRKVSLDRLSSPEQLDQLMQVTTTRGWMALAAIGALLVAVVTWAVVGSLPERVVGQGILVRSGGIFERAWRGMHRRSTWRRHACATSSHCFVREGP
jgi:HlyD family secretion protein